MPKMMLIAGEASGDTLGAELVEAFRTVAISKNPDCEPWTFFGAGGAKMEGAGVDLDFDLTEHAVVGIWEVLKNYTKFKRFFDRLLHLALVQKPEVIVLIDYPGFNLRFARTVRNIIRQTASSVWNPKIIFYVSPQIWAWHEKRVYQIARDIDLLLSIFPFEKKWYAERVPDFQVEFVGHPLVDRFRSRNFKTVPESNSKPVIALLPGSRVREIRKHLPVMIGALDQIRRKCDCVAVLILPNRSLESLARRVLDVSEGIEIQVGGLAEALSRSSIAIASSGTVTMECAYLEVPTVVMYKTSWSTYQLGKRFINVKYIAMPNLLAGEEIFPEFIQGAASHENIASAAMEILSNPQKQLEMKEKLRKVKASLGDPGASRRAAEAILDLK